MTVKTFPNKSQAGFTLMEILVVMVIIGILISIGVNTFISSQQKGRDARRKEDLGQITTALEVYYNDKGSFPAADDQGRIMGCESAASPTSCDWGTQFADDQATYMVQLPDDPIEGYKYFYQSAGDDYVLYAHLENEQDGDLQTTDDDDEVMTFDGTDCAGQADDLECNYAISSTNIQDPEPTDPGL